MDPIFNKHNELVGWLEDPHIYSTQGRPTAFMRNINIFNFDSQFLGTLKNGFVRDKRGYFVGYMIGANGGRSIHSIPPISPISPRRPPSRLTPPKPPTSNPPFTFSQDWSDKDWENFLSGN